MGRRIDFYDAPAAPAPNSLVPSVNVVVTNETGEILMIRRSDSGNRAVPGGAIDLGEALPRLRSARHWRRPGSCEITGLIGTYIDPRHVILCTSDGEARQEFSIVLTGRAVEGEPTPGDESREARWVPREEGKTPAVDRSMRLRIGHFLAGRAVPHIG
ncbi:NUDIX domain-containing protein [Streptosporangium canum]